MSRAFLRFATLLFGVILVFILLIDPGLFAAPVTLLIGWLPSFARLLKAWHANPGHCVLFSLAVLILIGGAHAFLRWLNSCLGHERDGGMAAKWRWKWTLCGFGILACTLLAIGSLILTTHQVYWISKSTDPLFSNPIRERFDLLDVAITIQKAAEEEQWDELKTRDSFWNCVVAGHPAPEAIQPVWIEQGEHRLQAVLLIPRRPTRRAMARLTVIQQGAKLVNRRLDELPQVLASFGIGNVVENSTKKDPVAAGRILPPGESTILP